MPSDGELDVICISEQGQFAVFRKVKEDGSGPVGTTGSFNQTLSFFGGGFNDATITDGSEIKIVLVGYKIQGIEIDNFQVSTPTVPVAPTTDNDVLNCEFTTALSDGAFLPTQQLSSLGFGVYDNYTMQNGIYSASNQSVPSGFKAVLSTNSTYIDLTWGTGKAYKIQFNYTYTQDVPSDGELDVIGISEQGQYATFKKVKQDGSGSAGTTGGYSEIITFSGAGFNGASITTGSKIKIVLVGYKIQGIEVSDFKVTDFYNANTTGFYYGTSSDLSKFLPQAQAAQAHGFLAYEAYGLQNDAYAAHSSSVLTHAVILATDPQSVNLTWGGDMTYHIQFDYKYTEEVPLDGELDVIGIDAQGQFAFFRKVKQDGSGPIGTIGKFSTDIAFSGEGFNSATIANDSAIKVFIIGYKMRGIEIDNFWIANASNNKTIYVDAVNGHDLNNGSYTKPVKTLPKAQDLVRAVAGTINGNVTVYLRQGTYTLTEPLTFDGSLDSLECGKYVTYKNYNNEKVYVSGGLPLSQWTVHDSTNGIAKISVPGDFDTRDLYVNGIPAVRARTPELQTSSLSWDTATPNITYNDSGALANSANKSDMEVVFNYQWCTHRVGVSSITTNSSGNSVLTMDSQAYTLLINTSDVGPADPYGVEDIWYFENSYSLLNLPGEWYLDRAANFIYYKLRSGETAGSLSAYAGALEELMINDPDSTLKNIAFEGLTFCNSTWMQPDSSDGYISIQAGFFKDYRTTAYNRFDYSLWLRPDATIKLTNTNGIRFDNNDFINLGNSAIDMQNTKNAIISGNLFTDCGGTSVLLGSFIPAYDQHTTDLAIITENCQISNNYIHNICTNMQSAAGLTVGYSRNIDVLNNTIHYLPYSGMSYGWGWGQLEKTNNSTSWGGKIANNRVYDVMLDILDGGGIYTLSSRNGLVIESNYVHGLVNQFGGIYLDHSSAGYTIRYNVLHNNANHLLLTSYRTNVHDNFLDDTSKVRFIGFKDYLGNVTDDYYGSSDGIIYELTQTQWSSLGNQFVHPASHTGAIPDYIMYASGVMPEYKTRFGIN